MEHFTSAIYFSLFVLGFIIGLTLIANNRKSLAYSYFGLYNLITAWGYLVSFLIASQLILKFPHFYRTTATLHYLWGPLTFLFIRSLLTNDKRFYLTDILHFSPFFIHLVELLPYYFSPADVKSEELVKIFNLGTPRNFKEGLLPAYYHGILKFISILAYNIAQWRLLWKFTNSPNHAFIKNNKDILNWVKFINITGLIFLVLVLYQKIFLFTYLELIKPFELIFVIYYLSTLYYLIYKPQLLSGIQLIEVFKSVGADKDKQPVARKYLDFENVIQKLETYMQASQPFLKEDLNLNKIAHELYLPEYKISKALKYKFDINFPEYVNRYRISYIEDRLKSDPEWFSYTIEGIAFSAGFNSRNAFYTAFRKIKQVTPSEYFRQQIIKKNSL